MENLVEFLKGFDVHTLLPMIAVMWYFTRDIRNEIRKEIEEIRCESRIQAARSDKLSARVDTLYEMFVDLLKEKKP